MEKRGGKCMFCNNCGAEINDEAVICPKCGCKTNKKSQAEYNEPKTGVGVAMGLFLGVIGLVIGWLLYPSETISRQTFLKGWVATVCICVGLGIFYGILAAAMAY